MWWNTHYTNGEATSHQFIMLLDPRGGPRTGKREKLGQSWDNFQTRGVPLSQPEKPQKMVHFHEKKVQNKHWIFFSLILNYSEHSNFSWKFTIFGGVFRLGQGNPTLAWKLSQLCPNFYRFLPPHLCRVCFITFMASCMAYLVLGSKDQLFSFFFSKAPLRYFSFSAVHDWLLFSCSQLTNDNAADLFLNGFSIFSLFDILEFGRHFFFFSCSWLIILIYFNLSFFI